MERLLMCYRAKPEKLEEYLKAHREVWPEITRGLKEAGCKEMTIFGRGTFMAVHALIEDIEEFNRKREADPHYRRWAAWMDTLLELPFDDREEGAFAPMEEIWRFEA